MRGSSKRTSRRSGPSGRRRELRLLFTCVGRRIELLEAFRRAAGELGVKLTIHGADINWTAPAIHWVDVPHIVPRIHDRRHIPELLRLAKDERIDAVIPLIDSDLRALSHAAPRFARQGCTVVISDEAIIRVCRDKLGTYQALRTAGIDTPQTWSAEEAAELKRPRFPLFLKPRQGSAGKGLHRLDCLAELNIFLARAPDSIVQEYVEGVEHTLDVYAGLDGVPRCVVPRRRIEVRSGEVSKGLIVKDPAVMEVGRRVVAALGHCRGVITVQCMVTPAGRIRVFEVNPRFGGGAPLSIAAGADFPKWIMAELLGRSLDFDYYGYRDNLAMLRYDQSVFVDGDVALGRRLPGRRAHRSGE